MVVELTGTPEERTLRELQAFAFRDAPHMAPDDLPVIQRLDAERMHALHDMFKRTMGEIESREIRRAADTFDPARKRVGGLYVPKVLRERFGIPFDMMLDESLDLNDVKTKALIVHERTHQRQDAEGRWLALGFEGREREAQDAERAFFDLYERTGLYARNE